MKKLGQQTVEYAIVLGVLAMVLTGMYVYVKRGIQATIKQSADQLGSQQGRSASDISSSSTTQEINTGSDRVRENNGGKRTDYSENKQTNASGTTVSITD